MGWGINNEQEKNCGMWVGVGSRSPPGETLLITEALLILGRLSTESLLTGLSLTDPLQ